MASHGPEVPTRIEQRGVFIDVVINHPNRALAGIKARGLIDTGSDHVLISRSIAKTLKLRHVGDEDLGAIGGMTVSGALHSGVVQVPHLRFERLLPLYAVDWDQLSHSVLLGRSFLKHFVFRYDGPSDVFRFSQPID